MNTLVRTAKKSGRSIAGIVLDWGTLRIRILRGKMVMLQTAELGVDMPDGFEVDAWERALAGQRDDTGEPPIFGVLEVGDCIAMEDRNSWEHE